MNPLPFFERLFKFFPREEDLKFHMTQVREIIFLLIEHNLDLESHKKYVQQLILIIVVCFFIREVRFLVYKGIAEVVDVVDHVEVGFPTNFSKQSKET